MDHYEMVEKLREKANVSYEEAKAALEACDWDVLDALVLLESEGKVDKEKSASYSTEEKTADGENTARHSQCRMNGRKIRDFIVSIVNKGNENAFVIKRHGEEIVRIPLSVLVLLLVFLFHFMLVALLIGLFCGLRYAFEGPLFNKSTVNHVMDQAADKADEIKQKAEGNVR